MLGLSGVIMNRSTVCLSCLACIVLLSTGSSMKTNRPERRAERGDAEAQYNLAAMCFEGRGTAQNNIEAYLWGQLAADQDPTYAERLKRYSDALSPDEVAEAEKRYKERAKKVRPFEEPVRSP